MNKQQYDNAKMYFNTHSDVNVMHFTQNGEAFFEEKNARAHANDLRRLNRFKTAEFMTITREDVDNWKDSDNDNGGDDAKQYDKWVKKDLIAECKKRELEFSDKEKNADLAELLENDDKGLMRVEITEEVLEENPDLKGDVAVGEYVFIDKTDDAKE